MEVKKQPRENTQALVRRFSRSLLQSGILRHKRKNRYKARPKSRQGKKKSALRREQLKKYYARLKKMGEL